MESGIKSSFIPQDATVPQTVRPLARTGFADLLILIAIVFLVASLALAAGVFLYVQYLETSSTSKLDQLQRAREAFEPSLIQELTRLDDRMHAASTVLESHIAPTIFFRILEQLTLKTVAFSNLTFQGGDAQNMTIAMDGVAQSVNSIALQADNLSKSGALTNPIFSNIDRRADGVHFNLTAIVNPVSLEYGQLLFRTPGVTAPVEVPGSNSPFGAPPSRAEDAPPRQ
jgi:hypothetical protein